MTFRRAGNFTAEVDQQSFGVAKMSKSLNLVSSIYENIRLVLSSNRREHVTSPEHSINPPIDGLVEKAPRLQSFRQAVGRRLIRDPVTREWLVHELAMREARRVADFDRAPFESLDAIRGFEDLYWLFTSNELNMGLSQLRLDEAAHLYQHIRCHERPPVAELGRYKGGTTFLLAAAGAQVLSLEINPAVHNRYLPQLTRALDHFELSDRVDARVGDAYSYNIGSDSFQYVLVHCSPPTYAHTREIVEHWWPAVSVGGYLILHETRFLPGESEFIKEFSRSVEDWRAIRELNTPGENVFFQKQEHCDRQYLRGGRLSMTRTE